MTSVSVEPDVHRYTALPGSAPVNMSDQLSLGSEEKQAQSIQYGAFFRPNVTERRARRLRRVSWVLAQVVALSLGLLLVMLTTHQLLYGAEPSDTHHTSQPVDQPVSDSSIPAYPLEARILETNLVQFRPLKDRLQQPLDAKYVHMLLEQVNKDKRLPEQLQPLESAFVRIITPAEFKVLNAKGVTIDEINDIAYFHYIVYTQYTVSCIGVTDGEGDFAAYIRVKSQQWDTMREEVAALFYKKGGHPDEFKAEHYHPHLTIGHTHPGVLKDDQVAADDDNKRRSCWADIRLVGKPW